MPRRDLRRARLCQQIGGDKELRRMGEPLLLCPLSAVTDGKERRTKIRSKLTALLERRAT